MKVGVSSEMGNGLTIVTLPNGYRFVCTKAGLIPNQGARPGTVEDTNEQILKDYYVWKNKQL